MRRFERLTHACSNDSHTRTRARLAHKVQEWVGVGLCPLIGRLGWVLANGRAGSGRRECRGILPQPPLTLLLLSLVTGQSSSCASLPYYQPW